MQKQNLGIAILSVTALVLLVANFLIVPPAKADVTIKDRGYQMCTAVTQQGIDGLYVLNNQTGMISCYSYDATARRIVLRGSQQVADLFTAPPGMGPGGTAPPAGRGY